MTEENATIKDIVEEARAVLSPDPLDGVGRKARKKAEEPAAPATQKYMVINGAIAPNGGGRAALIQPGSVVELTSEQAKHYNKMGYLKPYIED